MRSLATSAEEANPFMGFRAIRLCLEHKDLFKEQFRAILRASVFGKAKLMYPMVTSASEIVQANQLLEETKKELRKKKIDFDNAIEIGCMIETPSAALTIDALAKHCNFFSIGTNDLIQYVLAVDRVNDKISHMYQPNHPGVVRMLKQIVDSAHKYGAEISVCGEVAGDPQYAPLLLGLGVDALSVTPGALPEIKYIIRHMKLSEAKKMAKDAIEETDPETILQALREFYLQQVGDIL